MAGEQPNEDANTRRLLLLSTSNVTINGLSQL
jgi:hypothetical protein